MHGKPVSCSFVYIFPELSLTINCFHPSLFGGRVSWPQLSGSHSASNPELLGTPAGFRVIHTPPFLLAPDATPGGDPQTVPRGLPTQAAAAVTEFSCPCSAPRQHVGFDKLSSGFFQPLPAFRDLTAQQHRGGQRRTCRRPTRVSQLHGAGGPTRNTDLGRGYPSRPN